MSSPANAQILVAKAIMHCKEWSRPPSDTILAMHDLCQTLTTFFYPRDDEIENAEFNPSAAPLINKIPPADSQQKKANAESKRKSKIGGTKIF